MPSRVERLKLMPDYGVDVPLWAGVSNWEDLELPEHLIDRLRSWQADFDDGYRVGFGWLSSDRREAWARESERIIELLREHLDPQIDLVVDLWPMKVIRHRW